MAERRLVVLQVGVAQREIGAVAQARSSRRPDSSVPTAVRNGSASVDQALAHQRDAQVVLRVRQPVGLVLAALPVVQQRDGFVEALLAHEDVAEQVHALGFEIRREPALHFLDGAFGAIEIAARVPDLAEIEPGAVAHALGHRLGQQRFETLAGLVVQAERQIEAAEQQVRLRIVMRHAAPLRGRPAGA